MWCLKWIFHFFIYDWPLVFFVFILVVTRHFEMFKGNPSTFGVIPETGDPEVIRNRSVWQCRETYVTQGSRKLVWDHVFDGKKVKNTTILILNWIVVFWIFVNTKSLLWIKSCTRYIFFCKRGTTVLFRNVMKDSQRFWDIFFFFLLTGVGRGRQVWFRRCTCGRFRDGMVMYPK